MWDFFLHVICLCVNLFLKKSVMLSFDWVKIKGDYGFAKWVKLKGLKVLFLNLGDQNRKFVKFRGPKVHFSLFFISKSLEDSNFDVNYVLSINICMSSDIWTTHFRQLMWQLFFSLFSLVKKMEREKRREKITV